MNAVLTNMTYFNDVPALYSGPEGEERVMMIASDVSREFYTHNVMLIRRADDSTLVVAEGNLKPMHENVQHLDECECDDCYADLDEETQREVDVRLLQNPYSFHSLRDDN